LVKGTPYILGRIFFWGLWFSCTEYPLLWVGSCYSLWCLLLLG